MEEAIQKRISDIFGTTIGGDVYKKVQKLLLDADEVTILNFDFIS